MGVGTNTHTSSHYASSNRRWVNEFLTYFGYPFFLGLSATFWWRQHVTVHHTSPNVIGVDDDADLAPWLARTWDQVESSRGVRRFYYAHLQWLALPLLLAFNSLNMTKTGLLHLLRALADKPQRTRRHWLDLTAMVLHYVCLLILPALALGARPVLALYLLRLVLMGYLMFAVLAPGHFPTESVCLSQKPDATRYLLLQTLATNNFRVGPIGRLLCSGLQYQIEHHLFPGISHVYYPEASKTVQEFCYRNGLPYRSYAWDAILWKCLAMFRQPPRTVAALEPLPRI
jgi:fatty acid desaturase